MTAARLENAIPLVWAAGLAAALAHVHTAGIIAALAAGLALATAAITQAIRDDNTQETP